MPRTRVFNILLASIGKFFGKIQVWEITILMCNAIIVKFFFVTGLKKKKEYLEKSVGNIYNNTCMLI